MAENNSVTTPSRERIFISYKRYDKDKVFKIKDGIEKHIGERCWIDMDGIESDAQFVNVIIGAINRCDLFLFMYSKKHSEINDPDTDWTIKELNFAREQKKRIVFVNIDGTPLSDYFKFMFGTKQQIDINDDEAKFRLFNDIRLWLGKPEIMRQRFVEWQIKKWGIRLLTIAVVVVIIVLVFRREPQGLVLSSPFSTSEQIQKAKDLYLEGNALYKDKLYEKATELLLESAELGHASAQCLVGVCYEFGRGVQADSCEAAKWYKKAADQGNARAQCNLASCYMKGIGVNTNLEKAFNLYKISAEKGYVNAMYYLAECYEKAIGTERDRTESLKWYEKADLNGHPKAKDAISNLR